MAKADHLDEKIVQVNQRLKAAQLGLQIERRHTKLNLRGTLPPRPASAKLRPHQQRLCLGLPATPTGLKQAEQEVKIIAGQLLQHSFDWHNYLTFSGGKRLSQMNLAEQLQAFEQHFLSELPRQSNPAATKTTWNSAYAPYVRKLAAIAAEHPSLTLVEAIYKTVQATELNSRSRQLCCTTLSALAAFLMLPLPHDLKVLAGEYGSRNVRSRQLPSDEEIVSHWKNIPNPAWRFVYGVMATYGLRNHEVFFCNFSSLCQPKTARGDTMIEVLPATKTGSHQVWAFYPEWIEEFELRTIQLPDLETDLTKTTLQRIGQRVTAQFRRYGIPFSPYNLRHAWAVRTIHFGLPDTVAAKMMGHSVAVHTRTYHQWITARDQQQAVDLALSRRGVPEQWAGNETIR
ncbi:site-specific integrase [Myxacorys almedinensis]|uniref:Site-specific integrase n=1 Tax=Myxacorys almedinensis A TaxID=2690445 RepID=A0A8J7YXB7_9CYAN|nr:site-specific integrase [Myxacorys almedinensis]NDJ16377.1 site-specific integrase [Myxacorys almedinensis A]